MIGKNAESAAIRASAKVSGIGQPRIHHPLQDRTYNDHILIGPQTFRSEEYLSWSPVQGSPYVIAPKALLLKIREWISRRAMLEYRRNRNILVKRFPGDEPAIE